MITAETVNGIVRFQANGLPVVSLYGRVEPGASPGLGDVPGRDERAGNYLVC